MPLLFVADTLQHDQVDFAHWLADSSEVRFVSYARTEARLPLFVAPRRHAAHTQCDPTVWDTFLLNEPGHGYRVWGELYDISDTQLERVTVFYRVSQGHSVQGVVQTVLQPLQHSEVIVSVERWDERQGVNSCPPPPKSESPVPVTDAITFYQRCPHLDVNDTVTAKHRSVTYLRSFDVAHVLLEIPQYHYIPVCSARHPPQHPQGMLLIIIDGVGDVSYESLQWRTPLQDVALRCPGMSVIACHGVCGMMDPVAPGVACGSDTAHLNLLGYTPYRYYRGRGAFESLGAGLGPTDSRHDVAFKGNFATLDVSTGIVAHRRCDRNFVREGPILSQALDGLTVSLRPSPSDDEVQYMVRVRYATEHRCAVLVTGPLAPCNVRHHIPPLSDDISGTDPLKDGLSLVACRPDFSRVGWNNASENDVLSAQWTCQVINKVGACIHETLAVHPINEARRRLRQQQQCALSRCRVEDDADHTRPANIVLLRGSAKFGEVPPFNVRHGLRGFVIAPTCVISGIGLSVGLTVLPVQGTTGDKHSDFNAKADAAVHALRSGQYDFGLLHIKAVDDAGHDRSLNEKVALLERIAVMLEHLWLQLSPGDTVAITADHSTPCVVGDHTADPVPFAVATKPHNYNERVQVCVGMDPLSPPRPSQQPKPMDRVTHFDEVSCVSGALGRFDGTRVMCILRQYHMS